MTRKCRKVVKEIEEVGGKKERGRGACMGGDVGREGDKLTS